MKRIAITGASGAIGSALALEYAASDVRLWLQGSKRPGSLCRYGDNVPIMPVVYDAIEMPDGETTYSIWSGAHVRDAMFY